MRVAYDKATMQKKFNKLKCQRSKFSMLNKQRNICVKFASVRVRKEIILKI